MLFVDPFGIVAPFGVIHSFSGQGGGTGAAAAVPHGGGGRTCPMDELTVLLAETHTDSGGIMTVS
jgi:hypothetical protein